MRLLGFVFLAVAALVCESSASLKPAEMSDKIVRQILLSPDGTQINFDSLEEIAEQLYQANQVSKLKKSKKATAEAEDESAHASNNKAASSSLALNDYVTVGRQPSTSKFLGLSSMCDICASVVKVAGQIVVTEKVWPQVITLVKRICPGITGGFPQYVCDGYIDSFEPIIYHIMPTMLDSPYSLCDAIFSNLGCGKPDHQHTLWEIPLPAPLSDPVPQPTTEPTTKDKLRVLLMTDIHIDPEYEVGSPARCKEPMCCRNTSTPAHDPLPDNERAGYWGDYRVCDLPLWSFDDMLHHANVTFGDEIDFVFVAGDLPPHDTWNQSAQVHMDIIDLVAERLSNKFPGKPVFFAVGNHESAPVNAYPLESDPKKFQIQWLYDKFADVWMKWLDPAIANATIRKAGFYTVLLKPGWRLVTINDNYCISQNFFLYGHADISDPYGHLKWLVEILNASEAIGERVQILGHVPPGDADCLQAWSWNYYRIISRYSHIITGQFFGHIHKDYFVMYYDAETLTEPRGVAFVGPPGTPFSRNNIAYRIYDYDPATFAMDDYHTWYVDVDEANARGDETTMPWKLEYSAKSEYGLPDMTPASWSDFASRMQNDFALFMKYQKHYQVTVNDIKEPCGTECRRHRICEAYEGLSKTPETWCERWFPAAKTQTDDSIRKCSARFIKRADLE